MRPPLLLALIVGAHALAALAGSGVHAQSQGDAPNLLPNGDFEQGDFERDPPGWVTDGATPEVVGNPVHEGAAAGKVSSLNKGAFTLMTQYWLAPAEARAEHTLHVWLRTDADDPDDPADSRLSETEVWLEFLNTSGGVVLVAERRASLTASWQLVDIGPTAAPPDTAYARVRVTADATGPGATFYVDSVRLTASPAPPAPTATTPPEPIGEPPPVDESVPTFFASLMNGDFELPGKAPWGWRTHAADAVVSSAGGSRLIALTSKGGATAWLHQSFAVQAGRWYEARGRLRTVSNASLARIRVAWYASEDSSGAQLSTADSEELNGVSDSFADVSTGAIRAPDNARSARLRVMLLPAGPAPAVLHADDVSFARTAPPPPRVTPGAPTTQPSPTREAAPSFFPSLANGDFELPGDAPYGWRAHAADALVTSEGGSRLLALTARGGSTAWLYQSFAVEGGRWYEAAGRLRPGSNADLARIRVAWYASVDASGAQLSTADSEELTGAGDSFLAVSTGRIRAPDGAQSAQLRIMLRPAGGASALLHADDVSFARTAPLPAAATNTASEAPSPTPEAARSFFASLTNGDFELPGDAPYGWRAHAGHALVTPEGGSRLLALTSQGSATAWLHQSFAVEGGRWYEAAGRLRPGSNAGLARIRIAWYASEDGSGPQLATADSDELSGSSDLLAAVSTGRIRAPDDARSAQLRIMLRPAGEAPAVLHADDVSFARTAPPPAPTTPLQTPGAPSAAPEVAPTFFAALTNGDFELPGEAPYGWRAHAGAALVATEGGSRAAALISRGRATAWLHQSFAVEGGRWYEAGGQIRAGLNAGLARIRIAWYASEDASGAQLSTTDSAELSGVSDGFASVTTGAIRAPEDARSAELRIMLQPAGEAPALLHADEIAFARTAPPPAPTEAPTVAPSPTPEAALSFFASLTNGDFELPGETPYGWRAHAGSALVTTEGGSRAIALTSAGGSTAWLHQSFAVEGGRWYEASGRLWPGSNADLARIRVAWYASVDASGAQLSTADSEELVGVADAFASVSSGAIRAPDDARSAQLRIMLRPAGEAPAVLRAADVSFAAAAAPEPEPTPAPVEATAEAPSPTPGATPSPQAAAAAAAATLEPYDVRSASAILLRITELLPDPLQSGADAEYEWIEVGNVGMAPVSLGGLFLADNRARIALPALTLPPAGALVVAGPQAEIGDAIAMRHGRGLFNGLGNSGDRLALATADGAIIDALSYGSDDSVDQPPLKAPAPGRSLQRRFDTVGRLMETTVAEHPSPGRIEASATAEPASPDGPVATAVAVAPDKPVATSAAAGEVVGPAPREAPSSVEALRKQLDDTADWNRTAWIVLVVIAAVALAAAGAHRARELLRAPPPAARAAAPRRKRRWRHYASGLQVRRRRGPNRRQ